MTRRNLVIGGGLVAVLAGLGVGQALLDHAVAAQGGRKVEAPMFEVDPLWPKPLPNHWLIGSSIGVSVDAQDHVWIIHRPDTLRQERGGGRRDLRRLLNAASPRRRCSSSMPPATW